MKKIIYSLFIACLAFGFASCDKSTQDTSKITYFVEFKIQGDEIMLLEKGSTYNEPGVIATEGDDDISESIETIGTIDSSTPGLYILEYRAKNVDGFASSTTRSVIVYEGTLSATDISGTYTSATTLNTGSQQYSGGTVTISKVTDGIFNVSCLLGSWYLVRYPGYNMAAPGIIQLSTDNTIVNYGGTQQYWQDEVTDGGGSYYDPSTGHVHLNSSYAGYTFICDMSK
jgi:hypothetical protein